MQKFCYEMNQFFKYQESGKKQETTCTKKSYFHSVFITAILKLHSIIYKGP